MFSLSQQEHQSCNLPKCTQMHWDDCLKALPPSWGGRESPMEWSHGLYWGPRWPWQTQWNRYRATQLLLPIPTQVGREKGSSAGGSSEEATHCCQCSDLITRSPAPDICIRRCKLAHLRFGVFHNVTKTQKYLEPNPLTEHRNSYQGGFRNKTITANCSKGYDKPQ